MKPRENVVDFVRCNPSTHTRDLESFRVNRPWLQLRATRLPLQLGRERDREAVSI